MSQLGRISGPLLDANLNRLGVDLTFRNYGNSEDLLYLKVTNDTIGVNKEPVSHKLEIDGTTRTTNLIVDTQAQFGNVVASNNNFTTYVISNITVRPNQANPLITADHIKAGDLSFKDNIISNYQVNGSVKFDPNGSGIVDIQSSATINGNLTVNTPVGLDGKMQINGNLTEAQNIIIGDNPIDTVIVAPDFSQSIIPGDNLTYDLGASAKRWRNVYAHRNLDITNLTFNDVTVSSQLVIESGLPSISTLQSNDDVILNPSTGLIDIERIRFNGNTILNLDPVALTLASTGIGYVRFVVTDGMVLPSGTDAERPVTAEVGSTRWNNDNQLDQYLECFDGTTWNISTGAGGSISTVENYDLANAYILILG
jgi:cytoskeletal protein CcmA (bactofilin family)